MRVPIALKHNETGGYTAYVPSLQGCISDGKTREEALVKVKQLLLQYLETLKIDVVFEQQEREVIATISELPNCTARGLTEQEALHNLQKILATYVEADAEEHIPKDSERDSVTV